MIDDEDNLPRPAPTRHELGQPLDKLSVAELDERIATLRAEIERLQATRAAKAASLTAADMFFKK
ncbi:MAG: DUF1192 domain-containing protein [Methylocystis sp.]|nr:DUF1192 domain-containing protein [Methylocystis sp.]